MKQFDRFLHLISKRIHIITFYNRLSFKSFLIYLKYTSLRADRKSTSEFL